MLLTGVRDQAGIRTAADRVEAAAGWTGARNPDGSRFPEYSGNVLAEQLSEAAERIQDRTTRSGEPTMQAERAEQFRYRERQIGTQQEAIQLAVGTRRHGFYGAMGGGKRDQSKDLANGYTKALKALGKGPRADAVRAILNNLAANRAERLTNIGNYMTARYARAALKPASYARRQGHLPKYSAQRARDLSSEARSYTRQLAQYLTGKQGQSYMKSLSKSALAIDLMGQSRSNSAWAALNRSLAKLNANPEAGSGLQGGQS